MRYTLDDLKFLLLEHLLQLIASESMSQSTAHKIAVAFDKRQLTYDPYNHKIATLN